jgi:integrase
VRELDIGAVVSQGDSSPNDSGQNRAIPGNSGSFASNKRRPDLRMTVFRCTHAVFRRANPALRDVKTESSAASVPLPAELIAILRRHRRDQFGDTRVARANTLGLVFTTKNGTPLAPRNVNRSFETLCRRANVRSIRLHDLRHSCATLLFAIGVEAATVQRILRHSSISVTTGTYVDVIEQVQRAAVAGHGFGADEAQ